MNLVNKNEDINLETNNAENNAIEYMNDMMEINISFNKLYLEVTNISKEDNITIPIQNSNKNNRTKKIPEKFRQFIFTEENSLEKQINFKV